MVTSSGPTRSVERMIVRARSVSGFQESMIPAFCARQRLAASTVISTSAGVFEPSERSRSYSSDAEPPRMVRSMPFSLAKSSKGFSSP